MARRRAERAGGAASLGKKRAEPEGVHAGCFTAPGEHAHAAPEPQGCPPRWCDAGAWDLPTGARVAPLVWGRRPCTMLCTVTSVRMAWLGSASRFRGARAGRGVVVVGRGIVLNMYTSTSRHSLSFLPTARVGWYQTNQLQTESAMSARKYIVRLYKSALTSATGGRPERRTRVSRARCPRASRSCPTSSTRPSGGRTKRTSTRSRSTPVRSRTSGSSWRARWGSRATLCRCTS